MSALNNLGRVFVVILLLLCSMGVYGGEFIWTSESTGVSLNEAVEFKPVDIKDSATSIGLDRANYRRSEGSAINLGFYEGGVWLKFTLVNRSSDDHVILELRNPILDKAVLYEALDGELKQLDELGDNLPFSTRTIKSHSPQFSLNIRPEERKEYYLFMLNYGEQFYLPMVLWDDDSIRSSEQAENYLFGVYFGILIFVFFFNLFTAIGLQDRSVYFYLAYVLGLVLLQLSLSGYSLKWLWGDFVWWSVRSTAFFASISVLFLISFSRSFLSTKRLVPTIDKWFKYGWYLVALIVLASLILPNEHLKYPVLAINATTFAFAITIIPVTFRLYRRDFKPARYFLLAFVLLILGVISFVFRNAGIVPNNPVSEYGVQIGSALEVVLLTFAIVDKFKTFRDQAMKRLEEINEIKSKANIVLEEKVKQRTEDLQRSNAELVDKNLIIEEKNKDITDSINYAHRIQQAILPNTNDVERIVGDSFVFYRPKDIVSGDFYWIHKAEKHTLFAVADCTGHGVPGAFMSMIGSSLLNQIVSEKLKHNPAEILNMLRDGVIDALKQTGEIGGQQDGMDMALCTYDHSTKELLYSGANNSLYLIRRSEEPLMINDRAYDPSVRKEGHTLFEIKAQKQPIGFYKGEMRAFEQHKISVTSGDKVYLFSDGFVDQFGGERGKKFKSKPFKELLLSTSHDNMSSQAQKIKKAIELWMAAGEGYEQIDDMCVMGVEV